MKIHDGHDGVVLKHELRRFISANDRAEHASFEHFLRIDGKANVSSELGDRTNWISTTLKP
jgi:hypothetical protein